MENIEERLSLRQKINRKLIATLQAIKTYPFVCLYLLIVTVSMLMLIESPKWLKKDIMQNLIFSGLICAFLSVNITQYYLNFKFKFRLYVILNFIIAIIFSGYYYYFLNIPELSKIIIFIILLIVNITVFLLLPEFKFKDETLLIQFSIFGFFSFIISYFFAIILFGGIASALGTVDALFDVTIKGEAYAKIWAIIVFFLAPVYFLSLLPDSVKNIREYKLSKFIKFLFLYIFLPLTVFYMLILYAYLIKIIFFTHFPKNFISYITIFYSFFGIITFYVMKLIIDDKEKITKFIRIFYGLLIPVIIVLFIAIFQRINEYGFTEKRYFIFLIGVYLLLLSLYFVFSRKSQLKNILVYIAAFGLFSIFAVPLNCFSVSKNSQKKRLEVILKKSGILINNKIIKIKDIEFKDNKEICSILDYFEKYHRFKDIEFFPNELRNKKKSREIINYLGIKYIPLHHYKGKKDTNYFHYSVKRGFAYKITGEYDYLLNIEDNYNGRHKTDNQGLRYQIKDKIFYLLQDKKVVYEYDLRDLARILYKRIGASNRALLPKELVFEQETDNIRIKYLINNFNFTKKQDEFKIRYFSFDVLVRIK